MRRRGADLVELSHAIHAEPELAFAEHRSCAKAQALVAERGCEITAAAGGLDTAFRADFGSGQLTIGVCAEYDALPEIGHACGHNIIAASAVGTAPALAEVADDLGLRVALVGIPAEEAGGGKALLLKAGVFDDISAAVMLHPGPADIAAARSLALSEAIVRYCGKESHAAVAPHLGVNALDAITVAQVAVGLLRQQLAPGQLVHGIVTDGGQAVNVIPGHALLQYAMRAVESDSLRELEGRMCACFAAGRNGRRLRIRDRQPRASLRRTQTGRVAGQHLSRGDVPAGPAAVAPEYEAALPMGSTDMGNVTQALPGIHPVVGVESGGAMVHQRAFADAAAGPSADRAVIEGAIMLARTAVALAQTPAERDRVLAAHERRRGGAHP